MRIRARLVSCALLGSSLAAVAAATVVASPASAGDSYTERWCSTPLVTPCIQSFSINGVPQTSSSPVGLLIVGPLDLGGYQEVDFILDPNGADPANTDVLDVVVNTGSTFVPDRMLGQMGLADVDTWQGGDGDHRIRIQGTPVTWVHGCDTGTAWPYPCESATSNEQTFSADIAMLDDREESTIGMYVGTNAIYNGIFFSEQPDGTHALTTEVVSPHYFFGTTTPVIGSIRFRLSYRQMRLDMGIPNPETLTPGSLSGTINGGTGGGSFTTWHDPDGQGFFIEASGFTFSLKKLKVRAAHINPTRPTITRAKRLTARAAVLTHTKSAPRGAKVTSYGAVCRNSAGHVVRGGGSITRSTVVVTGLRRGKAYTCQVYANSKAGRSVASPKVTVRARP